MAEARQKISKDKGGHSQAAPDDIESKRLRDRAVSKGSLARAKANPAESLSASKAILKCNGKDIVKRGHRKNKYLFSFPGLLAPVAGGQLGELAQLDTKNPVMYISFPEGRLKLFGTLVYPKNKYLTLHFSKGAGNIACEDCFENMVVFSEYWWIGSKEENPDEERLDMPESLTKRSLHERFDFSGGAARQPDPAAKAHPEATASKPAEPDPDDQEEEGEGTPRPDAQDCEAQNARATQDGGEDAAGRRKSSRTAGRSFRFAEPGTDDELDDDADSDSDDVPLRPPVAKPAVSKQAKEKPAGAAANKAPKKRPVTINLDSDDEAEQGAPEAEQQAKAPPRFKREAPSAAQAPAGKKAKKVQEEEEDEDAGEASSEDLPSEPSDGNDSDEEWKL